MLVPRSPSAVVKGFKGRNAEEIKLLQINVNDDLMRIFFLTSTGKIASGENLPASIHRQMDETSKMVKVELLVILLDSW